MSEGGNPGGGMLLGLALLALAVLAHRCTGYEAGYAAGQEAGRVCAALPTGDSEPLPEPDDTAEVTAYTPTCKGCSGTLYSGETADPDARTVAANLDHWRIGECVALDLPGEGWTTHTVRDTGGALDRADQLDLLVATRAEAKAWGRRTVRVRRVPCASDHP